MGAGTATSTVYYNISNGKIVRQFPNKTATSVERVNKNMRTVHEEFYDYLDGYLVDLFSRETDYGKYWIVVLQDQKSGAKQHLQLPFSSGYAMGFLKALPNADITKPLKVIPHARKEGDKTKATIFLNQAEKSLKWYYTKDHPNGLPPLRKMKVKGKEVWDDTSVMEFLEKMVQKQILPKLLKRSNVPFGNEESLVPGDGLPF